LTVGVCDIVKRTWTLAIAKPPSELDRSARKWECVL
jgi:hypothetical protein